jgi:hypothetical protein
MDINVDLATVDNTLVKQHDGSYLYRLPDGKLDIDHYNRQINQYSEIRKNDTKVLIEQKLIDLNKQTPPELVYDLSIGQTLINFKDSMFDIMDDIINLRINYDTFTKNNRLYYLGLFMIMLACILFFYAFFNNMPNDKKVSYVSNIKIDS